MAGPTLPAHPDPPRPLTPIPFRRFMDPIDEITRLVQTIHELAVDRGVTEEVMTIWETGMLRICNGHDNQRALSTFASSVISCFLAEVRLMEAQLVIDSHVVRTRFLLASFCTLTIHFSGVGGCSTSSTRSLHCRRLQTTVD